jgi:hypothetical protein
MHNSTPSGRQRDVGTLPLQYACRLGRLYQRTKEKFSPGRYLDGVTMWIGERKEPWGRADSARNRPTPRTDEGSACSTAAEALGIIPAGEAAIPPHGAVSHRRRLADPSFTVTLRCSLVSAGWGTAYKFRPSGRRGKGAASFFRNAWLRSLRASLFAAIKTKRPSCYACDACDGPAGSPSPILRYPEFSAGWKPKRVRQYSNDSALLLVDIDSSTD